MIRNVDGPDQFRPLLTREVAEYLRVSVRTLESWRAKTRNAGEFTGPPFFQDYARGRVYYPEIGVVRFVRARAAGCSIPEASRFAEQPVSDLSSGLDSSSPDSQPTDLPATRRSPPT